MARILVANDVVNGYTIEEEIGQGNLAVAYIARRKDGQRVFLKMFKSPSAIVDWYPDFVRYENRLRERIDGTPLKNFICGILDFFEATVPPKTYFQVYEFVERGHDLAAYLHPKDGSPYAYRWERRVTWAKVIMGSILQMHQNRLVHGDLKPENLMLIVDRGVKAGYRLKLIDIDFAVMTDQKAPWDGKTGYVGTPGYMSPEHLAGKVPEPASDVFTCGIILSELLARCHPFGGLDEDEYRERVAAHAVPAFKLDGPMPGGNDEAVSETIRRMLYPEAARRPDAAEVLAVLNGAERKARGREHETSAAPPSRGSRVVVLAFESFQVPFGVSTRVGRELIRQVGNDAQYWDAEHQFTLDRRGQDWYAVPSLTAANETLHNGRRLQSPVLLAQGDQLGVGREAKGIIKTPARILFS